MLESKLLHAGTVATHLPWCAPAHQHDHHELILMLEGRMELTIGATKLVAGPGDVLLYRAGQMHDERSLPPQPFRTYFIAFAAAELPASVPIRLLDHAGRLRQLARWLYEERGCERSEAAQSSRAFLMALLAELMRLATDDEPALVGKVRSYVSRHLASPLNVDDLARHVGISKYHFIRVYRTMAGTTPMAAVRTIRVKAARDLILTTDLPLKEIAEHCGLGNPQHFARLFRAHFAVCPSTLRGHRG